LTGPEDPKKGGEGRKSRNIRKSAAPSWPMKKRTLEGFIVRKKNRKGQLGTDLLLIPILITCPNEIRGRTHSTEEMRFLTSEDNSRYKREKKLDTTVNLGVCKKRDGGLIISGQPLRF